MLQQLDWNQLGCCSWAAAVGLEPDGLLQLDWSQLGRICAVTAAREVICVDGAIGGRVPQSLGSHSYSYYTTLHYTTLHYTTLHYTTLHYTTLHYTTLHYTTLHYTTLSYAGPYDRARTQ